MKKLEFFIKLFFLFSSIAIFFSCQKGSKNSKEVFTAAQQILKDNKTIRYEYRAIWDNRFNSSVFRDSAKIIYSKLESNFFGMGFIAETRNNLLLYNGRDYLDINHNEKEIIKTDKIELEQDSSFFDHQMIFLAHPYQLLEQHDFVGTYDTLINNVSYYCYKKEVDSTNDDNELITNQKFYIIDKNSFLIKEIKQIVLIDQDIVQSITYDFDNYHFESTAIDFDKTIDKYYPSYATVRSSDKEYERTTDIIQVGTRLKQKNYEDITGKKIALYGKEKEERIIMFSFIGCGGCEYALREMKKKDYNLRDGIKLYYSSPRDKNEALKNYFDRKEFPFNGFGEESKMNKDFSIYSFPTFVLIDSEGVVKQVNISYDDGVDALLFD